jgi:hypothetical protein
MLERKDVRLKLEPDAHAALSVIAEIDGLDLGEWCERVIVAEIGRRLHEASVIAARMERLGILGKTGELPGISSLKAPRK